MYVHLPPSLPPWNSIFYQTLIFLFLCSEKANGLKINFRTQKQIKKVDEKNQIWKGNIDKYRFSYRRGSVDFKSNVQNYLLFIFSFPSAHPYLEMVASLSRDGDKDVFFGRHTFFYLLRRCGRRVLWLHGFHLCPEPRSDCRPIFSGWWELGSLALESLTWIQLGCLSLAGPTSIIFLGFGPDLVPTVEHCSAWCWNSNSSSLP